MSILDELNKLDFIEFVKQQKCCVCFKEPTDAHHLKAVGMGRNRKRKELIEHLSVVPLCRFHHTEYHSKGLKDFELKYGENLWKENHRLLILWLQRQN